MSESRPLRARTKGAIALAVLGLAALIPLTIWGVRERRRALLVREEDEHLHDLWTRQFRIDYVAWNAKRVFVVALCPGHTAELQESWVGDSPTREELCGVSAEATWPSLSVLSLPRGKAIVPSRLVVLLGERDWVHGTEWLGVVDQGTYYSYDDGNDGIRIRSEEDGLYECGPEPEVKSRIQHLCAVRRALDATPQQVSELAKFLKSDVEFAQRSALTRLGDCGPDKIPVLKGVLDDPSLAPLHERAREVLFWTASAK